MTTPTTKNRAFLSAYKKGYNAGLAGSGRQACPYPDLRGSYHQSNTWSRAFRRYWFEGFNDAKGKTP